MAVKDMNISFATAIPIFIENAFKKLKFSSFSRGYHVYKDLSIPIIGDDSLLVNVKNIMKMMRTPLQLHVQLTRSNSNFKGDSNIVRITKSPDYTSFH